LSLRVRSLLKIKKIVFIFLLGYDIVHFLLTTSFIQENKKILIKTDEIGSDLLIFANLYVKPRHSQKPIWFPTWSVVAKVCLLKVWY